MRNREKASGKKVGKVGWRGGEAGRRATIRMGFVVRSVNFILRTKGSSWRVSIRLVTRLIAGRDGGKGETGKGL